jgi:fatty acid desaturase
MRIMASTLRYPYICSIPFYIWKFASTTAICVAAVYITLTSTTLQGKLLGGLMTALFWQQCGWLAHDFAHHQVFRNRMLNDFMVLIIGNLYQGFSMDWWKNKHNTHHAIPNIHESEVDAHDGDPDIDTLPFLAWSVKLAKKTITPGAPENTGMAHFMMDWQAFLYFPILLFARITWSWQSFAYAFNWGNAFWGGAAPEKVAEASGAAINIRYPLVEKLLITLHYAFFGSVAYMAMGSPLAAFGWWVMAECAGGILLAIPFGVGHNGMEIFDPASKPGFAELQVRTTRNVNELPYDPVGFVGWFTGGLHLQVEHHLFPMVPRHNLPAVRAAVEPLCKKHGVPYRSVSLWKGTVEVLTHLSEVSHAIKDFPAA